MGDNLVQKVSQHSRKKKKRHIDKTYASTATINLVFKENPIYKFKYISFFISSTDVHY